MAWESLGMIQHYGLTPSINALADTNLLPAIKADEKEINILMSEIGDIRHILKTMSDLLPLDKKKDKPINIYFHERNLENLARAILLLTVMCETALTQRERMELFLDLYGNSMIRARSNAYLQSTV
jgi:dynein assembly factor 3